MKEYEIVYIMNPNFTEENVAESISIIEKLIAGAGGIVSSSKNLGRKPIQANFRKTKNLTLGFFAITLFQLEGKNLKELGRKIQLQDKILKHSIMIASKKVEVETVEA